VTKLDAKELEFAWTDDTTLGWVYQYWNDPERAEIDAHLDAQNKLTPAHVGPKTQVFTERYMVEWLLQNGIGFIWLCICKKNGWTPDADRVFPVLEARRADWLKKRAAGEVTLEAVMPIDGELEDAWKYYVQRPTAEDVLAAAPKSIRELRVLDPACGSGHFLVIAFGLLVRMYREEARHRDQEVLDREIAEAILANNLHGVDIDSRAIQIAAAALYLKAKAVSPEARPSRVNLVAPTLQLGNLPDDDPSLVQLRTELKREAGISEQLTRQLVSGLTGVDHLGTLLKVDDAVEQAVRAADLEFERSHGQGDLFGGFAQQQVKLSLGEAKATVLGKLEQFLARRSATEDLGLRLDGEQIASGIRFIRIARERHYHVVVGNPPYFGTQALAETGYIDRSYPQSKENLCTALLDRAMELVCDGGQIAFVTVRNWLYVSQLSAFRSRVFRAFPPTLAADLGLGGFESLPGVEVVLVIAQARAAIECVVVSARDASPSGKEAAILCCAETHHTDPALLARLPGSPFVYRWTRRFVEDYLASPLVGEVAPVRVGMKTSDNLRFLRCPWEVAHSEAKRSLDRPLDATWVPYVKGAAGKAWIEPLSDLVNWRDQGLEIRVALDAAYGMGPQAEKHFFKKGVAFTTIGRTFLARAHRFSSIFDVAGSSVFPSDVAATVCLLNSRFAREIVEDLNPTINFQVGDVARIPFRPDPKATAIFEVVEKAYSMHETCDEVSIHYRQPAASAWRYTQAWAQSAVDRAESDPLPSYQPEYDQPAPEAFISFALGVALGRFGAGGEGILERPPDSALPAGILFASTEGCDSLDHPACTSLVDSWNQHGPAVGGGDDLRAYLRKSFFDHHRKVYENRPIYFAVSSGRKSFVAFISIHCWKDDTLQILLADHLIPERRRLEGELEDIRQARGQSASRGRTEKRFAEAQKLLEELKEFTDRITQVAECGPPAPDGKVPEREVDARFVMELNDGVMVSSAALWPLLEPQWKDPKKWWAQIAARSGPKGTHFDWSDTAKRYFPGRIARESERDPVLASAHRLLWKHHAELAYAWELRLREDTGTDFAITEPSANELRSRFLAERADVAQKVRASVAKRQRRRSRDHSSEMTGGADE
jgi:hypothetical protein